MCSNRVVLRPVQTGIAFPCRFWAATSSKLPGYKYFMQRVSNEESQKPVANIFSCDLYYWMHQCLDFQAETA